MLGHTDGSNLEPPGFDPAQHRARVLDALSRHSDPILREIGAQLADGVTAPHDLLRQPAYVDALKRGLEHLDERSDELRSRLFGAPAGPAEAGAGTRLPTGPTDDGAGTGVAATPTTNGAGACVPTGPTDGGAGTRVPTAPR